MPTQSERRFAWIALLIVLAVAYAVWLIMGEVFWRDPRATSDSESAIVQPTPPTPTGTAPN